MTEQSASNPWGAPAATEAAPAPATTATGNEGTAWGVSEQTEASVGQSDWLNSSTVQEKSFDILNPFDLSVIPLDSYGRA